MRMPIAAVSAFALSACAATAAPPPRAIVEAAIPADLVVRNVTVIDPQEHKRLSGRDVAVLDGRITAVVPTGSRVITAQREVDGAGKFLMPGLIDMHAHASFRFVHQSSLKMMIANGVTGLRDMGSDCVTPGSMTMCLGEMRAAQAAIEAGDLAGPRLLELSSAKVGSNRTEQPNEAQKLYRPTNGEQARATVAGLAARGVDIIKTSQDFAPEPFRAMLAAARQRGLKVGGHIPEMFSVGEVAAMGMTSIEHARDLPVDCSTYGATFRNQGMARATGKAADAPDRQFLLGKTLETFDPATCAVQIRAMVDNGTYYVPTHLTREMDYRAGDAGYRADPRLIYVTKKQQDHWNGDLDRTARMPGEMIAALTDFFAIGLRTTGMAHDAGVKVMAGTDANDTMIFPGFSLHDELRHLVAAGLTPMEAIQAATSVPAEYFGRTADFGGVSAGKLADLVLLDADPTADIANSTRINAVVQGGRLMDRAALDALLAEYASGSKWPTRRPLPQSKRKAGLASAGPHILHGADPIRPRNMLPWPIL